MPVSVIGSRGWTAYSWLASSGMIASDSSTPAAMPSERERDRLAHQHPQHVVGCAPRASRTPTSWVRSLTSSDITP